MNPSQRALYCRYLWPAACAAQGWLPKDEDRRRAVTLHATRVESTRALKEWQITALFTYLRALARPDDVAASAAWCACSANPEAYNQVRQGRYWERAAYREAGPKPTGDKRNLRRDRFKGAIPQADLDRPADSTTAREYLLTSRRRYQKRVDKGLATPVQKPQRPSPQAESYVPERVVEDTTIEVDQPF